MEKRLPRLSTTISASAGSARQLLHRDDVRELLVRLDVHHVPEWLVGGALRVRMVGVRVPRRIVRVPFPHDGSDAHDAYRLRARMPEQQPVAWFDVVAQPVPHLEVADAVPLGDAVAYEVVVGVGRRFGLEQPVAGHLLLSSPGFACRSRELRSDLLRETLHDARVERAGRHQDEVVDAGVHPPTQLLRDLRG